MFVIEIIFFYLYCLMVRFYRFSPTGNSKLCFNHIYLPQHNTSLDIIIMYLIVTTMSYTKQYSILSNETGSFVAMQCKKKILHLILAINSNLHLLNPAYLINAASMFYILAMFS